MTAADALLLGIDGGGTTCRGALRVGASRFDARVPGANASSDFEAAIAALRAVLAALAQSAGKPPSALLTAPSYLGLAGVTDKAAGARVCTLLGLTRAVIEEDRRASVVDALGDGPGAVAVIGTGSFLARQDEDGVSFVGGHGLALGDEASGAWLGREALAHALRAADGMAPETGLTSGLRARFGGRTGVTAHAAHATPRQFAELAPDVLDAAAAGDAAAVALMRRGADYLEGALAALGADFSRPVCLTGGIGPAYAPYLAEQCRAAVRPPLGTAPDGALRIAGWVGRGWRPETADRVSQQERSS
jgi:glucosamine kinase